MNFHLTAAPTTIRKEVNAIQTPTAAVMERVKIMLRTVSAVVLKQLAELGFQADPAATGARFLTGSIDASKLEALRKFEAVLRVEETQ